MKNILLSIIIPIYNSEKYLKDCLDSIVTTNKDNVEIILIDDGSTDNSYKICREYQKSDNRIILKHQTNSGVSTARNIGLDIANGKYITFVDSDDILDNNWESILDEINENDIYFCSNKIKHIKTKDELVKAIVGYNDEKICLAGPFSKIINKNFLDMNKIRFNEKIINGEDLIFNLKCLIKSDNFKIINNSFYNYRVFLGSTTKKFDKKIFESDILFHNEIKKLEINGELKESIELYNTQMAIYVLLNRISYIDEFKEAKKYYSFLEKEPYRSSLKSKCLLNKKYHLILKLSKQKRFLLIYLIFRIIRKLKNKKHGFYFYKI